MTEILKNLSTDGMVMGATTYIWLLSGHIVLSGHIEKQKRAKTHVPALFQTIFYTGYALFSLSAFAGSIPVDCASRYSKNSFATCGNNA